MVEPGNDNLSITAQCCLLSISRSGWYYDPKGETPLNLKLMRLIDEQFLAAPYYGSRQMARHLRRQGYNVGRHRVRRLMRQMGIEAVYQRPRTSDPHPGHKIYPYLLKGLDIARPGQVWCADITYIPVRRGFLYLVAIMDWYSRKVLSWRLSNTMDTGFCVEALEEALARYGRPEIFNTDQGSQFTSFEFTGLLKENGIKISMDGKGRWMDNVFIERLWRSLKYECVYLNAFDNGLRARREIGHWLAFYNAQRPHSTFDGRTPDEVYDGRNFVPPALGYALHPEEQNTRQAA
ncbi:putative transposase [Nitrosomonas nitrosa]|nr:putative transposase [Nitrosomonas nitrosa]